jgi:glycosyltransferase involved in cell wall biosynthesis
MPPQKQVPIAMKRLNVLMLAFACEPDEGSEPEVGWKWAQSMADFCHITVVTQSKNKPRIEVWNQKNPNDLRKIQYFYFELGPIWRWLKKKIPGGMYLYYTMWQWKLRGHAARLLLTQNFDLIHHVTFASFRMPVWVKGKPVVWGPVGGAEVAMMPLLKGHGTLTGRMRECLRNFATHMAGSLVCWWEPTRASGGIALASTPATARLLDEHDIPCQILPTIGFDAPETIIGNTKIQNDVSLRLLFVGRLHLLKGIHLLLHALSSIENIPVTLDIVGDGPEEQRLRRLVKKLNLESNVKFLGRLHRTELPEIFAIHDVVVAPSLYESGGLAVLEGFAQGKPAIVLDCGGHAISVDESCGIKIPMIPNQQVVINALAGAILTYESDRQLVVRHGLAARQKLRRTYGWDGKCAAMLRIYQNVIEKEENFS